MSDIPETPFYSGRPMTSDALENYHESVDTIPENSRLVSIEEARKNLPRSISLLTKLQSLNDLASDVTEELDIVLESYDSTHEHVMELADYLANLVKDWHNTISALEKDGARMASIDPGRLEWYGVVDGKVVLYSWCSGDDDIEWYHHLDGTYLSRKPLIEA